jgi:hypothetical protein
MPRRLTEGLVSCREGSRGPNIKGSADVDGNTAASGEGGQDGAGDDRVVVADTNVEVVDGGHGESGAEALRRDGVQDGGVDVLVAHGVVLGVVVEDGHGDVCDRDIGGVGSPAIVGEGSRVLVELASVALLPELLSLLDGDFNQVRVASSGHELHALGAHNADLIADGGDLVIPFGAVQGVDIEILQQVGEAVVVCDALGGAVHGEPHAELFATVRVPVAEVVARTGVPIAVALSSGPVAVDVVVAKLTAFLGLKLTDLSLVGLDGLSELARGLSSFREKSAAGIVAVDGLVAHSTRSEVDQLADS